MTGERAALFHNLCTEGVLPVVDLWWRTASGNYGTGRPIQLIRQLVEKAETSQDVIQTRNRYDTAQAV